MFLFWNIVYHFKLHLVNCTKYLTFFIVECSLLFQPVFSQFNIPAAPDIMKDYYSVLQVDLDATSEDIIKSYRSLALKYHPDRAGVAMTETFQQISHAYRILSDPITRQLYDKYGPSLQPHCTESLSTALQQLAPFLILSFTGFTTCSCYFFHWLSGLVVSMLQITALGVSASILNGNMKPSDFITIACTALICGNGLGSCFAIGILWISALIV